MEKKTKKTNIIETERDKEIRKTEIGTERDSKNTMQRRNRF